MLINSSHRLARAGLGLLFAFSVSFARAAPAYWQESTQHSVEVIGDAPSAFRAVELDWNALRSAMTATPDGVGFELALPAPDGSMTSFLLSDSGVMPPSLAARYPEIRSFVGTDENGTQARVDISPLGLQATVYAHGGIWLVRPERLGMQDHYLSFRRGDLSAGTGFRCETHGHVTNDQADPFQQGPQPLTTTGLVNRDYRAAVAANHQYVQAVAAAMSPPATPTVSLGLAAVVAAVNRVNQPYGQDFSIRLSLIATNDQLIFPDAAGDTFGSSSFNNGGSLNQITSAITGIVGAAGYDIGHLFTTGAGGVAGLGVVCSTTSKGRGTTGLTNGSTLQSDTFYIDYVAHEMGHQFGGNHTFNGSASSCGGGNRSGSSAYEPGSGSTIQAYAGICGSTNNLQPNSDPYFHARSLQEMGAYSSTGNGGSCSANTPKVDAPPVVLAQNTYTIPANTPYVLTGAAASIALGSNLTYGWEQYDLGAANNTLTTDLGTGPIQRSWLPTTTPRRYLPRLSNLLAGTNAFGEILPTTTRSMTYRLTVRDNVLGGGSSNSTDQILAVVNTAGPFVVTAPAAGSNWSNSGSPVMVGWNVAMTDLPPVSCAKVNIDLVTADATEHNLVVLSPLAANVANSGTAMVPVPNLIGTARVRVACTNNIFFNISPPVSIGADFIFQNGFDDAPPAR